MTTQEKKRGAKLAETLQEIVNKKVADGTPRTEIIAEMAEEADVLYDTVNEVIKGSIICPAFRRLEAYAKVLGVDTDILVNAAIDDGCTLQRERAANKLFDTFWGGLQSLFRKDSESDEDNDDEEEEEDEDEDIEDEDDTTDRALAIPAMWDLLWQHIDSPDETKIGESWAMPVDIFVDDDEVFAILAKDGKLVKSMLRVENDELFIGEQIPVSQTFVPLENRTRIVRMENGRSRVIQIANTAVLNRVGEIDSRALFDSFIAHATETDEWPVVDVLHYNNVRIGQVVPGGLMRDNNVYINVWDFDDTPLGRAAEANYCEDPGFWGLSIQFSSLEHSLEEVAEDIRIPVHTRGVHHFTSVVPETGAAAWFTATKVRRQVMNDSDFAKLVKLVGEDEAEQFRSRSLETNQAIDAEGQITRATPVSQEEDQDSPDVPDVTREVVDVNLEDDDVARVVAETALALPGFTEAVSHVLREVAVEQFEKATSEIATLAETMREMQEGLQARLDVLEQDEETKRQAYLNSLPSGTTINVATSHRPRVNRAEEGEDGDKPDPTSLADVAGSTMDNWTHARKQGIAS